MQRLSPLNPDTVTGRSRDLFTGIKSKIGMVPKMMQTMGHSPAVLSACLSFNDSLRESSIGAKLGEQIALAVANATGCTYCNTSHSFVSEKILNMDAETISLAKEGKAPDARSGAALRFARTLIAKKGNMSEEDFSGLRQAGFTEEEICEIIAHTAFNVFTNYFNKAVNTQPDFPQAELITAAAL